MSEEVPRPPDEATQPSADCVLANYVSNRARPLSRLSPMKNTRDGVMPSRLKLLAKTLKFSPIPQGYGARRQNFSVFARQVIAILKRSG
jgi:hypothetical protein